MKPQNKRIRELEGKMKVLAMFFVIAIVFLIIFFGTTLIFSGNYYQLEDQLQSCQNNSSNITWKNFVVQGDNVSIYVDAQLWVKLPEDKKGFSWWMKAQDVNVEGLK